MDIGIYLSQVLRQSFPTLRWEQHFESKQFVDYGQPILVGFHTTPFNPVRIVVNLAYGIASKEKSGNALRTLFDTWSKMI